MKQLSKPDIHLVHRLQTPLNFDERLVGYHIRERSGPMQVTMYSFQEVAKFLKDPFLMIDFEQLETWLSNVVQDYELAKHVNIISEDSCLDYEKVQQIRVILDVRLSQCRTQIDQGGCDEYVNS